MTRRFVGLAVAALLPLGACASIPRAGSGPADFTAVSTVATSTRARLFADCVGQAASAGTYREAHDEEAHLILFTCTGGPARAFYDGLAERSAAVGSEVVWAGRTYRSTNAVIENLFGVDYCSTDGAADVACVITLNAGEFLGP